MRYTIGRRWLEILGWLADRPVPAAIVSTLLLLLFAALIRAPVIEGSMLDQLSGTNERLEIARRISAASGDNLTAAVIVSPGNASIATVFDDLADLRERLITIASAVQVHSVDAASDQLFLYGLTTDRPVAELLAVLRDNNQSTTIINSDATRFLIAVTFPESLQLAVLAVFDERLWPNAYASHTVLASAQLEQDVVAGLEKDLRLLIPVIVTVTLIALFLAFGYWRALLLPLYTSIASTVVTFALFSASVITINLVTLLALPIVLIVGLANSCHFLAKSEFALGERKSSAEAVRLTVQRVGPPFFFSALTTAIALASLGFNEFTPIANLGLLSAAALLIVFLLVLLAAPLSLRWYLEGASESWRESPLFNALSRCLARWRVIISLILLVAMLAGAATVPLLTVKSEPRAFFPDAAPFSSALQLFEREFYAFSQLRILVSAEAGDALAALGAAGALRATLAELDSVRQVSMQPAINSDRAYILTALLAQDDDLTSLREHIETHPTTLHDDFVVIYSNASLVYGDIDRQAMESLLRSLGWSVALIFGAILIVFRSLRAVLSAMLTNAVPLMLVCGAVWLIGSPLNLVTVFVFLVALGVVVDDSIHILFWRAAGDRVSGSSIEFSVLLSTLMLCLGLFLCQLSDFPTTRTFAAYCALALVAAVVSNLTVLPLLLSARSARAA